MTRGNQRELARLKAQKQAAGSKQQGRGDGLSLQDGRTKDAEILLAKQRRRDAENAEKLRREMEQKAAEKAAALKEKQERAAARARQEAEAAAKALLGAGAADGVQEAKKGEVEGLATKTAHEKETARVQREETDPVHANHENLSDDGFGATARTSTTTTATASMMPITAGSSSDGAVAANEARKDEEGEGDALAAESMRVLGTTGAPQDETGNTNATPVATTSTATMTTATTTVSKPEPKKKKKKYVMLQ